MIYDRITNITIIALAILSLFVSYFNFSPIIGMVGLVVGLLIVFCSTWMGIFEKLEQIEQNRKQ